MFLISHRDLRIKIRQFGIIVMVLMPLRIKRMQRVGRSSYGDRNRGETKVVGKDESTRPA